jgi:hypothetical protein
VNSEMRAKLSRLVREKLFRGAFLQNNKPVIIALIKFSERKTAHPAAYRLLSELEFKSPNAALFPAAATSEHHVEQDFEVSLFTRSIAHSLSHHRKVTLHAHRGKRCAERKGSQGVT